MIQKLAFYLMVTIINSVLYLQFQHKLNHRLLEHYN
jgi:hypothetical protein